MNIYSFIKKNFFYFLFISIFFASVFLNIYLLYKWKIKTDLISSLIEDKKNSLEKIEKEYLNFYKYFKSFNAQLTDNYQILSNENKKYQLKKFKTQLLMNKKMGSGKSTAYLEIINDKNKVLLVSGSGHILHFDIKNLKDKSFKLRSIDSNITHLIKDEKFYQTSYVGVRGIKYDANNQYLYISYSNEINSNCYNLTVLRAKFNYNYLLFEEFFNPNECFSQKKSKYNAFSVGQSGGRIVKYKDNAFIVTVGSHYAASLVQKKSSIFGKTLLIDNKKNYSIFSLGHRNPQGLFYDIENDIIIETEHGPRGGDEVNIIKKGKNYGWPVASYGSHYRGDKSVFYKDFPLPKPHSPKYSEPIFYFKDSVAISNLVKVDNNFSGIESYLISSMKPNKDYNNSINLYQMRLKNNKLKMIDYIPINERIRDLAYIANKKTVILFLENTASIAAITLIN